MKVKKGDAPSPRHSHSAVVWKNSLFIFGGSSEKGKSLDNTLHSFNFGSLFSYPPPKSILLNNITVKRTWQQVSVKESAQSVRWGHSAVVFGSSMFIFGGCNESFPALNQLFQFDFRIHSHQSSPPPPSQCPNKQNREESMDGDQSGKWSSDETQPFSSDPQQWDVHLWRIFIQDQLFRSSSFRVWYHYIII